MGSLSAVAKEVQAENWGPEALKVSRLRRRQHQDAVADTRDKWVKSNKYFYTRMARLLRFIVEPGKRVLEVRCQTGHLLNSVSPAYGVGVDISEKLTFLAQKNFPSLHFKCADPEDLDLAEQFDYVLFSHVFDTVDLLTAFERVRQHCTPRTRLIIINYNPMWQPVVDLASKVGLRSSFVEPNWVNEKDLSTFLNLSGFRPIRTHRILLFPKYVPLISSLFNDLLGRLPGLRKLCIMQVVVARLLPEPKAAEDVSVSVVVPCRNEKGNVLAAVERLPKMGKHTEIIFCDDKSTDGTADEVRRLQGLFPDKNIRLLDGPGICKAENVWTGFRGATGDVLMILDADLTVMPEELPFFFKAIVDNRGEFINGSRLVYPVPRAAMKFANRMGNKVFGTIFSFLLAQHIKDTLCGTKVLWRRDWARIEGNLGAWGIKDLWGDYELLFGASKLHLEITEVPVHYQERVYGVTKMTRVFWNGARMFRMCGGAWRRLHG
jgi:hypothetical protein